MQIEFVLYKFTRWENVSQIFEILVKECKFKSHFISVTSDEVLKALRITISQSVNYIMSQTFKYTEFIVMIS